METLCTAWPIPKASGYARGEDFLNEPTSFVYLIRYTNCLHIFDNNSHIISNYNYLSLCSLNSYCKYNINSCNKFAETSPRICITAKKVSCSMMYMYFIRGLFAKISHSESVCLK